MKTIDLTGQKFGRLTVIERAGSTKHGAAKWMCECDCGNKKAVIGDELRKGNTTSCGCYAKEVAKETATHFIAGKNKTHGITMSPIYREWTSMKQRCYNTKNKSFKNYGGRNIKVCDRWVNSFDAFYKDVSKLPNFGNHGYSLNRIDNNGDYEPNNVEWADAVTQANNRRSSRYVCYNGQQLTIAQLSRLTNMPYKKIYKRIVLLHWEIEKAISTP